MIGHGVPEYVHRGGWNEPLLFAVAGMLEADRSTWEIAELLGCNHDTLEYALNTYGISPKQRPHLSANQVARRLGVGEMTVIKWIQRGWLRAHRGKLQYGPWLIWRIHENALIEFLENPEYWPIWQPDTITDDTLQRWAIDIRREGPKLVSNAEVARRFCVEVETVNHWAREKRLPSLHYGHGRRLYFRESDLETFVPPCQTDAASKGRRRWTAEEEAILLRSRLIERLSQDRTAAVLGRNGSSIRTRERVILAKLAEPPPMQDRTEVIRRLEWLAAANDWMECDLAEHLGLTLDMWHRTKDGRRCDRPKRFREAVSRLLPWSPSVPLNVGRDPGHGARVPMIVFRLEVERRRRGLSNRHLSRELRMNESHLSGLRHGRIELTGAMERRFEEWLSKSAGPGSPASEEETG